MLHVGGLFRADEDARLGLRAGRGRAEFGYEGFDDTIRTICTRCGWARAGSSGQLLGVGSAVAGEGKTFLAEAIALSMARDHATNVLLIECDLLQPTLRDDFGIEATKGLSEVLEGEIELDDAVRLSRLSNLWLLPAGVPTENPSRLLRSPAMAAVLEQARSRYAFVVMDLPAVLVSSDATVLARQTDGLVLVTRAGRTDQRNVQQALQLLSGVTIHGVVLNRWRSAIPDLIRRLVEA